MWERINDFWQKWPQKYKLISLVLFALILSLMIEAPKSQSVERINLDTFIPQGHVLVPIEIENYESLDSVLGPYGVVDLYSVQQSGELATQPAVKQIKILRSPEKPDHFAVLAPEGSVHKIMTLGARFHVVVKNPGATGTEFVDAPQSTAIQILVEDAK